MCRCDTSLVPLAGWTTAPRLLRLWVRIPPGAWMSVFCECCVLPRLHKEICWWWDSNQHSLFPKATASTRSAAWVTPADFKRQRIEAAEMKLLRPLAGYTLYDHKTNNSICRELQITCILDKIDEYRLNWLLHLQRMPQNRIPWNHTTTDYKEGEELEDRRNVGESSCNSEKEWIKGSNPWCLWWWWWWWW